MTRVQTCPNGEQQRVIIERDFYNEEDLNVFLAEFEENMAKISKEGNERKDSSSSSKDTPDDHLKAPGYLKLLILILI